MAFIPVPNGIEVVLRMNRNGQEVLNVWGVDNGGPVSTDDLSEVVNTVVNWWDTNYYLHVPTDTVFVSVEAIDLSSSSGETRTGTVVTHTAGALSTGGIFPNNVTAAVSAHTDLRGRSYRGRTFLPGIIGGWLASPNTLSADAISDILSSLTALIAALEAISKILVIISRFTAGAPRVAGVMTPVTFYSLDSTLDSQRRRLPGRGA